ncbi:MAG: UvrD-helicase domain-containing protein [Agathobacter sp.]|nr:UvrD-helicase domain-containing protein [Agathobacter sp.]
MLFALDYNDNKVHIDDTHSNQEYYCPGCGATLVVRRGEVRRHHFAHHANRICADSWERDGIYDISEWHENWQNCFPRDNQEVGLVLGETKHRADVLIDRTVVEFQHSVISPQAFDDRNNFYLNLGYKVIWLFDMSEQYDGGELFYEKIENMLKFVWKKPKKTFNAFDVQCGCIELFFQIKGEENDSIVRVMEMSQHGFESFETSCLMSKQEFLSYVGYNNGICLKPDHDDLETNKKYIAFKEKHNIILNNQQERALQAVEGAVLLLAVPGSGKTTVLIDRIGYMVLVKGILPENILVLSYNKDAAQELQSRYDKKFGNVIGKKVNIRTLNSLALNIYKQHCEANKEHQRDLLTGTSHINLIRQICKEIRGTSYISHGEILEVMTVISYVKNMMKEDVIEEYDYQVDSFSKIYIKYQQELEKRNEMDFDDQLVFAFNILKSNTKFLNQYRNTYRYICVDEAQDTSKIQHEILKLLAVGNSIFMVGDEDQSIYGFRGAYPKALLNFRYNYRNPYILKMEKNYRSTKQIVDAAQRFISRNQGRYEKSMISERGDGDSICKIHVKNRQDQYLDILEVAKNNASDTAILYRDNDSAVVLADLLFRNNIPFNLKKPERSFYDNLVVRDIVSYLRLALNEADWSAFENIWCKGILYIKRNPKDYVCKICKKQRCSVFEALRQQEKYISRHIGEVARLQNTIKKIKEESTVQAIQTILDAGYENYCREKHLDVGKVEILLMLAEQEPDVEKFLERLKELDDMIKNGVNSNRDDSVLLSTIHTSKGQEYDTVYMIDVYDGRFPSSHMRAVFDSKDAATNDQEERRLFYVGITRAKNTLNLYEIQDAHSMFISELFGSQKNQNVLNIYKKSETLKKRNYHEKAEKSFGKQNIAADNAENEKKEIGEEIRSRIKKFPTTSAKDYLGHRWFQCKKCSKVDYEEEFAEKGGLHGLNYGVCKVCNKDGKEDTYIQLRMDDLKDLTHNLGNT